MRADDSGILRIVKQRKVSSDARAVEGAIGFPHHAEINHGGGGSSSIAAVGAVRSA